MFSLFLLDKKTGFITDSADLICGDSNEA